MNENRPSGAPLEWRRSSYSGSGGGNCVEIAEGSDSIHIRDSKTPTGPTLIVPSTAWNAFVRAAATGA